MKVSPILVVFILNIYGKTVLSATIQECNMYEFNCTKIGSCISEDLVCDGIANCPDQSDEAEEICKKIRCESYTFTCGYGACIDRTKVCDGKNDCVDGSDEYNYKCILDEDVCPIGKWTCKSGECIDASLVCNHHVDCHDRSDEEKCYKIAGIEEQPGSCRLPLNKKNFRYMDHTFEAEYTSGGYVPNRGKIKVTCSDEMNMNVTSEFDFSNRCNETQWDRDWSIFPKCQRICRGDNVTGRTIKTACELNGNVIPCNQWHFPQTKAHIECAPFYEMAEFTGSLDVRQELTCLPSGRWNAIALQCTPKCGRIPISFSSRIVNGMDAPSIAEIPWVAAIYKRHNLICGGSIISERLIISAAHCFFKEELNEAVTLENATLFEVAVGKYYRNYTVKEDSKFFNVQEIITVSGYNGLVGHFVADFAIVLLEGHIVFQRHIIPICLYKNIRFEKDMIVPNDTYGIVGGYGYTTRDGNLSEVLKIGKLTAVDHNQCKDKAPEFYKKYVTYDKFCAGSIDGGDTVCQGDSGSGLVFPEKIKGEEVYFLRGVVSNMERNDGTCNLNFYAMFTNVHNYFTIINSARKKYQ